MIEHKDTVRDGEVYGKRELAKFHRNLFKRGAKINLPDKDEGVYLEKFGKAYAWVLVNGGKGGKLAVTVKQLEEMNVPVLEVVT